MEVQRFQGRPSRSWFCRRGVPYTHPYPTAAIVVTTPQSSSLVSCVADLSMLEGDADRGLQVLVTGLEACSKGKGSSER